LGQASLEQALFAGLIGFVLVMIYMIVFYRLLGVVADIALIIYAVIFWGILNAIGATLTLPGVAGMILTLGMAVDANIIIFARMREEVEAGKTLRTAIDSGFRKALSAIVDANATTLITALVLFWAATGGVRGFALTLGVGVALSFFSATLLTRALLTLLSGVRAFRNHRLLGFSAPGKVRRQRVIPFMRYRRWYLIILGAVTVFAFVAIFVLGLNLGIEFEGGSRIEVKLDQPASTNEVRDVVESVGVVDTVVQPVGDNTFLVTASEMSSDQYDTVIASLDERFGATKEAAGLEEIGPSFGQETAQRALIAIAVSILVMIIYISWRFEYKFAFPAIIALVHDVGLTLGVYAITGRLVTAATVAALLTILGYSVNDTIIVFDRIRENTNLMKRESYADMVDRSIRQTITRSLNTAITTLLPVGCILFFGGSTLKDVAFALFIGIASGAYSSIFVAAPVLTMWKEREPRYRKRAAAAETA
jgi:SecD/SecF fusion protein